MSRAFAAAAALAVGMAGCTGSSGTSPAEPTASEAGAALKDALILSAVKGRLLTDDPDASLGVNVSVSGGVVTLRGSVKTAQTRAQFVADTQRTIDVRKVVDGLRVDPNRRQFSQQVGDVALAARVQAAIAAQLGIQHVTVTVDRGVATLAGTVGDAKTQRTIVTTARGTAGIRNVVDHTRVGAP